MSLITLARETALSGHASGRAEEEVFQYLSDYREDFGACTTISPREWRRIDEGCRDIAKQFPHSERIQDILKQIFGEVSKAESRWATINNFNRTMRKAASEDSPRAIVRIVKNSPRASKHLRQVRKALREHKGDDLITVRFGSQIPTQAQWSPDQNLITIRPHLPFKKKVSYCLFELTNALQQRQFAHIDHQARIGKIRDPHVYAIAVEMVEYRTCKLVTKIIQECIENEGWDPEMDILGEDLENWTTFQKYLADQISSGHTQLYLEQFRRMPQIMATSS